MASPTSGGPYRPGTLTELINTLRLAWALIRDRRISPWLRFGIPALIAAYLFFPIDLLPDLAPGLGQLDDLAVIWLGLQMLLQLAPQDILAELRRRQRTTSMRDDADVVDATYRVIE
ncbi:MAG: DUF1232 domain-containing protein [Anaerolineae bacterium]|nr:DUF1232 domain-containing protein [Caldilineales bacterium]MCX7853303.1 DUF1232 domain-containing protein [Caldilineales bacterium]MDW8268216.1 DUF1232 domain-containing protein [Anaerolineae bacterium]